MLAALMLMLTRIAPTEPQSPKRLVMDVSLATSAPVQNIFARSCLDCHSNDPHGPWYAKVAPFSWIYSEQMERARAGFNLSEWSVTASARPRAAVKRLTAVCAEVESRRMPPPNYARLGWEEIETLCDWSGQQMRILRKQAKNSASVASAREH